MQPANALAQPTKRSVQLLGLAAVIAMLGCQAAGTMITPEVEAVKVALVPTAQAWEAVDEEPPALEVVDHVVLAIHGGAGTIRRDVMTPELDAAYRSAIADALLRGHRVLKDGGRAADAVVAALHPLEDSHLFNAGRGAVLNDQGAVEMDASIMVGRSGMAGAVAGLTRARHPISAARAAMENTEHVMLSGEGADRFVEEQGLKTMPPAWFVTPHRARQLELLQEAEPSQKTSSGESRALGPDRKFGTVGCVALDEEGHLAAGTSTGGMARKAWGRIGDSPIIGAGTWADDRTCAVSCTGWGEFFIRRAIAHQIHARMLFGGAGIEAAASEAILAELPQGGGSGGCVALDSQGRLAAPFTTPGMYRGWVDSQGRVTVRIYGDERR